jgi:endonuclease YncB( thermonuclease family)
MQTAAKLVAVFFGVAVLLFFAWIGTGSFGGSKTEPEPSKTAQASSHPAQNQSTSSLPSPDTPAPASTLPQVPAPATLGQEKHLRLAREEADADRDAKLAEQHAIKPESLVKLHYRVKVRDGGTLEDNGVVIRLANIEAREADGRCTDKNGKDWACGSAARVALTKFIRYRAVSCGLPEDGAKTDYVASCTVGGVDLSVWMVRQGWAKPKPNADKALAAAAEAAKVAQLGIWSGGE